MPSPGVTPFQEQNLSRMIDIIERSSKAQMLAHSLWQFFEQRLECRCPNVDLDQPNRCRIEIEEFLDSRRPGDLRPQVLARRNARQEVGLVHELLHLNLIPLGFPRFRIWAEDDEAWKLAGGIINNADHAAMLPIFKSLGYRESEFVGPSLPETARELRVHDDLERLKQFLLIPRDYARVLSSYLSSWSIGHEVVWIADLIVW